MNNFKEPIVSWGNPNMAQNEMNRLGGGQRVHPKCTNCIHLNAASGKKKCCSCAHHCTHHTG